MTMDQGTNRSVLFAHFSFTNQTKKVLDVMAELNNPVPSTGR
jgi:hypothetical protein